MPGAFEVGRAYTRPEIYELLAVPEEKRGGDWNNGYHRYQNDWFIFANVGTSGRTGHNYSNKWVGPDLEWKGETGSKLSHKSIQSLISPGGRVLIFARSDARLPFVFKGYGVVKETWDTCPVTVLWALKES